MRNVFKIVAGDWQTWMRDGHVYSVQEHAAYLEMDANSVYVGAWDHDPTTEEVAEAVRVVKAGATG